MSKKYLAYIYGLLVAFVGFILYKFAKRINNFGQNNEGEDIVENNQTAVIESLDTAEISNTTISHSKAVLIANQQAEAMSIFWGTDEDALLHTLQGLNVHDLNLVAQKFGQQPYSTINTGMPDNLLLWLGEYSLQPLNIWYQYEISGSTMDSMRAIWSGTILDNTF